MVGLFSPMSAGSRFRRSAWPAHLTLVGNFETLASPQEVADGVRRVVQGLPPLLSRFGAVDQFGPDRDVPVQLVEREPFGAVHEALARVIEVLPGLVAEDPDYWHEGYRPHVTRRFASSVREGDTWPVRCVAVAELGAGDARVVDVVASP